MLLSDYTQQEIDIDDKDNTTDNEHYFIIHYLLFRSSFLLCLIAIANPNIVTGQRPTYIPSSCSPLNQRKME